MITNHPARYRDPKTGLPFRNVHAYRQIQRLHRGEYRWSKLLGAWAGSGTYAAKGVPVRFLNPDAAGGEGKQGEGKEGGGGSSVDKKEKEEQSKEVEEGKTPVGVGTGGEVAGVKTEEVVAQ